MIKELKPEQLRRRITAEQIEQELKAKVSEKPIQLVGQERALRALKLHLLEEGHIVVVVENSAPELIDFLRDYLRERVDNGGFTSEESNKDYGYAHNFDDYNSPILLSFPKGEGKIFKLTLDRLCNRLLNEVPTAVLRRRDLEFQERLFPEYLKKVNEILQNYYRRVISNEKVKGELEKDGLRIKIHPDKGYEFQLYDSELDRASSLSEYSPREQAQAAFDVRIRIQKSKWAQRFQRHIRGRLTKVLNGLNERFQAAEIEEIQKTIDPLFKKTLEEYQKNPRACEFLEKLKEYVVGPPSAFLPGLVKLVLTDQGIGIEEDQLRQQRLQERIMEKVGSPKPLLPFEINLIVDNSNSNGVPVVTELTPTYASLFGKAEREIRAGYEIGSDHSKIRPGKFHEAHGGYLILDLNDIYEKHEVVVRGLKRVLKEKQLRIVDEIEDLGPSAPGKRLTPEPLPLNCKVIVVVKPLYYYISWMIPILQDLIRCFPIRAEFDGTIEVNAENIQGYLQGIRKWAEEKRYLPVSPAALALLLEELIAQGCDLSGEERGNQNRFYSNLKPIQKVYREANFYARGDQSGRIEESHIKRAVEEHIFRSNLLEEQSRRQRESGIILIHTEGKKKGEINALAVGQPADYWLGVVDRVTATARRTHPYEVGGVDTLDRGTFAGKMYLKATETIRNFLEERFGQDKELYYKAQITFEQTYNLIDGPSASLAEMMVVYSAISGVPLRQDLAVTGTMDQHGEAGAIGGVNHKIRAFFDACHMKGRNVTGIQGLVIPVSNCQQLMLEERIVEAVKEGKFHIFAVENIEDALEQFTGKNYSEIHGLVDQKFREWEPEALKLEREKIALERARLEIKPARESSSFLKKIKRLFK